MSHPAAPPPAPGRPRGLADPRLADAIRRHNRRIGSPLQVVLKRLLFVYALSPFFYLALRGLFRVRVEGKEALHAAAQGRAIYAIEHFFEWDPFLTLYLALFPAGVLRPHLVPDIVAGPFWARTALRRAFSWLGGMFGVMAGDGPAQDCIARAADLLIARPRMTVAIFPTGPLGRSGARDVRPGLGHLASRCPDVPILPIAVAGVRELSLGQILRLRRPALVLRLGRPFRARDVSSAREADWVAAISRRVEGAWREGALPPRSPAAPASGPPGGEGARPAEPSSRSGAPSA
jgi:1-acyl-sn-glycerol-3-phosphate acyltransferase